MAIAIKTFFSGFYQLFAGATTARAPLPQGVDKAITVNELKTLFQKHTALMAEGKAVGKFHLYTWLKTNDFSTTLKNIDFSQFGGFQSSVDLSHLVLENCYFSSETFFYRFDLSKAVFQSCDFSNATFSDDCIISESAFKSCKFGSVKLLGGGFRGNLFENCQNIPKKLLDKVPSFLPSPDHQPIDKGFYNPHRPFADVDHELYKNFESKLDARRTTIEADNISCDLGSYFHGYGGPLVKNANLRFKTHEYSVELSFRLNKPYRKKLRQTIKELKEMSSEERASFVEQYHIKGLDVKRVDYFTQKSSSLYEQGAYVVHVPGVGTLKISADEDFAGCRDFVQVTLNDGATLESFHYFLSIFGLEDVLKKSTAEDLERLKLSVVLKTFFPSYVSEKESFFTLPLEELKQKLFQQLPKLPQFLERYSIESHELLPGYVRYGVRLDERAYTLGARALTTALNSLHVENDSLTTQSLDHLTSILNDGLFSKEMREQSGMTSRGLNVENTAYEVGGARSVYMQVVTQTDVERKREKFGYSAPVRLLVSLKALNQGSYQYEFDKYGTKDDDEYVGRTPLLAFLKKNLSALRSHEVMLPDRVLPKHIMGMLVPSDELKGQIIKHLQACNVIQDGKINNIDINDFILVGGVTEQAVKACGSSPFRARL